jgi:adenosine deaminase
MSLDTLAKVDLHRYFDGSIHPTVLAQWLARSEGGEPDPVALAATLTIRSIEELAERRQWLAAQLRGPEDLTVAALDLARRLIAEVVVHVELVIDPDVLAVAGMGVADVLRAIDAGCESAVTERDDVFLSWSLLVEIPARYSDSEACALVQALLDDEVPHFAGIVLADDPEGRPIAARQQVLELARAADLGRAAVCGDRRDSQRMTDAVEAGVQRLVGGLAAMPKDQPLVTLRARRTPLLMLPSAQVLAGTVRGWPSHPLRKFKEAGLFTVVGSGWPTWLGLTLSDELEQVSRHLHWRLDELRNLTTRAIEAAWIPPNLRFQLARTVEVWRHRPLVQAQAKNGGDPFSI